MDGICFNFFLFGRFWTTRMCGDGSEPPTISPPHASNLSFAPCRCAWTMAGIKSSLISPISHAELTAATTLKPSVCRFEKLFGEVAIEMRDVLFFYLDSC